jgi:molybdopterin synthase catalytic subunit
MAVQVFRQIAADIRQQWPDVKRLAIHHRMGAYKLEKSAF